MTKYYNTSVEYWLSLTLADFAGWIKDSNALVAEAKRNMKNR